MGKEIRVFRFNTTIKDCDFFERRFNDTQNIAENLEQVAAKLIKIQQVELAQNCFNINLIKLIGSIDLKYELGDLVILINRLKHI